MKSYWRASIQAPDGTETCETFEGSAADRAAWNAANNWLLHEALPQMASFDAMDVTSRARTRFTDALLSQDGEIIVSSDPWEMRLEHRPDEHEAAPLPKRALHTMASFLSF